MVSESTTAQGGARRPDGDRWLLASNLLTLVLALWQGWSLFDLLLPYWLQSVAIGVLQGRRMWVLQRFSTEGFTSNGKRVPETRAGLRGTVGFFAMHYGIFHLVYLIFVLSHAGGPQGSIAWYLPCIAALLVAEVSAHRDDVRRDAGGRPNLGMLMFLPYLRVFPMHAMIFIGANFGNSSVSVFAFVLLKTGSDWLMQWCERWIERRGSV